MPAHVQVPVKVNTHVDSGVRDLVEALSQFPSLQTQESCEGPADAPLWVCFLYGAYWQSPWRDLAEFAFGFLGPKLAQKIGDGARLAVRVTESGTILGELTVPKAAAAEAAEVIRRLAADFNASPRRSSAYSGGRSGTSRARCSRRTGRQR